MNATIDQVCAKVDVVISKFESFEKRNDIDHAEFSVEQKAITKRLAVMDVNSAVANTDFETHVRSCDRRHGFLNKILWTFAGAGFLGAIGLIARIIIGGDA